MSCADWIARLLRRPTGPPLDYGGDYDFTRVDARLTNLEHQVNEIEVRLRLLERQADPRGLREARDG
jgi:hypothetical protein